MSPEVGTNINALKISSKICNLSTAHKKGGTLLLQAKARKRLRIPNFEAFYFSGKGDGGEGWGNEIVSGLAPHFY